jgi:hypothetical protein
MSLKYAQSGPGNAAEYLVSGTPYVTRSAATEVPSSAAAGTPLKHSFPFVTRFFNIQNIGANPLRVGFTLNGVTGSVTSNYIVLDSGTTSSITYEIKTKELYFLGDGGTTGFEIMAGLTSVATKQFPLLTGSNGFEGVG